MMLLFALLGLAFADTNCTEREKPVDVMFVVDGSSSITDEFWGNQMFFLSKLIEEGLDVPGDRAGMVQFSGKGKIPQVHFNFSDSLDFIATEVFNQEQIKGGTATDTGLDLGISTFEEQPEPETDKDRHKVLVLLTDGVPNPVDRNPCVKDGEFNIRQRMKDLNYHFFILAVGMSDEDVDLLACLVKDKEKNIVIMNSFTSFFEFRDPTGPLNVFCVDSNEFRDLPTNSPTKEPETIYTNYPTPEPTVKKVCPDYDIPRPKILPCDKDGANPCEKDREGLKAKCAEVNDGMDLKKKQAKKQCNHMSECMWKKGECTYKDQKDPCGPCAKQAAPATVKSQMPWGGTQSPDYWYNCISRWCMKYTWMGGIEQCHYKPEYGCGCESLDEDECHSQEDCCYSKKNGCEELVECPRLNFDQCLANSDRCSACGNGGCGYKCKMGPGQKLSGFQNLELDCDCQCKVTQMF